MNTMIELLASEREADLRRESHDRRMRGLVGACRRRLLGILPIGQTCSPRAAC